MTTKIKWRLGALPTPEELRGLVADKLITKDEAREILFNEVEEKSRDVKSLESEIIFLRELVEKMTKDRGTVIQTIRTIERPYYQQPWYTPYAVWCGGSSLTASGSTNAIYSVSGTGSTSLLSAQSSTATAGVANTANYSAFQGAGGGGGGFSSIKTF